MVTGRGPGVAIEDAQRAPVPGRACSGYIVYLGSCNCEAAPLGAIIAVEVPANSHVQTHLDPKDSKVSTDFARGLSRTAFRREVPRPTEALG